SPLISGAMSIFKTLESCSATSRIGVPYPLPIFTGIPSSLSVSAASTLARATSSTNEKSRVCSPSSYSTGGKLFSKRVQKIAITPVYGLKIDWRGADGQEERRGL